MRKRALATRNGERVGGRLLPQGRNAPRDLCATALAALLLSAATLLFFGAGASSAATPTYTITDLGSFSAKSVNDLGQAVGYRLGGGFGTQRAVLAEAGQPLKDLGALPGATDSEARDVNNAGQVVGLSGDGMRSFLYKNGQMAELNPPSGYLEPSARAINNAGQVVGSFSDDEFALHAFLYRNGQMKRLYQGAAYDINDAGQVVGEMVGAHASLYDFGRLKDLGTLPNQEVSRGMAINDAGQVVGYAFNEPDGEPRAFLYENGQMKDLRGLAGSSGLDLYEAHGINDSGAVVGYGSYGPGTNTYAFVYKNGRAQDLNALVPPSTRRLLMEAHAITDDGEILVTGVDGGVDHAYLLKPDASQGDTIAPSVSIASPLGGAVYERGQTVTASYSCNDGEGGSGIKSCVGSVQTGSAIDTSTAGQKRFTVTATDNAGNKKVVSRNYVTVDTKKPRVLGTSPVAGATGISPGANVAATFSEAMNANTLRNPDTSRSTTFKLARKNPNGTTTAVAARISYSVTTNPTTGAKVYRATLNPDANLELGKTYAATVTSGAKDVAGNALDQNPNVLGNQAKAWTFRVRN